MKVKLQYIPTLDELQAVRENLFDEDVEQQLDDDLPEQCANINEDSRISKPSHEPLNKEQLTALLNRLVPNRRMLSKQQLKAIAQMNRQSQTQRRTDTKVQEKLIQMGKQMKQRRQHMIKTKEQQEMKLLRDRPQISQGLKIHQKPIKDRYKQVIIQKEQHLKNIRKKYKPAFAPEINSYSKFIAEVRNENDPNVINRLINEGDKIEQKNSKLLNKINDALSVQNTFRPAINKNTGKILKNNPLFQENILVQQRARILYSRIIRQKEQKETVEVECTFKPSLCSKSTQMISNTQRASDRLYKNAEQLMRKKIQRVESANSRYSFKPQINKPQVKSEYVNSEESYIEEDDYKLENIKTYDDISTVEKTQPNNKSIRNSQVQSRYLSQSRNRQSQTFHENKSINHCTFKPVMYKPIRSSTTLSNIYGMEGYLKNRDRANKLKLEPKHQQQIESCHKLF